MSNSGTFDGVVIKESKAGKPYGKVSIDSEEYLSFGNTLGKIKGASEGDTVTFSWKPSDRGDGKILTEFSAAGGAPRKEPYQAPVATGPKFAPTGGRSNDPNIQLSIFYGYAKDLVAQGAVKAPLANPTSVADTVSTLAREIMRKFQEDVGGTPKPPAAKQEIEGVENP